MIDLKNRWTMKTETRNTCENLYTLSQELESFFDTNKLKFWAQDFMGNKV